MNTIIPNNEVHENQLQTLILSFFKEFQLGKLLKSSNASKEHGLACVEVFRTLFSLVFTGKSFLRFLQTSSSKQFGGKDTAYRFLNSPHTNWRKFLFSLSSMAIFKKLRLLTSISRMDVLIVDDSLYRRNRSKAVELLAKVYDHVDHRFVKGFRMLTLGWSDGNSFIPLAFSLLSSENAKNRLVSIASGIDKRSNGYKVRTESTQKGTEVLLHLLRQAHKVGFTTQHVLFDSWFAFPSVLASVKEVGFSAIAMLKNSPKIFYRFNGTSMKLASIYSSVRKKRGKAKILASAFVELSQAIDGRPVEAKIVFVRDRSRSRQWLALITTDVNLSDEEVVRLYGKRWDIEVFFKIVKSYLKLGKEFYGRSYDSIVAHTTIVFARYILLSLEKRNLQDVRTLGGIFFDCCDELADINLITSLRLLMNMLMVAFSESTANSKQLIEEVFHNFIAGLPSQIKGRLLFPVCES